MNRKWTLFISVSSRYVVGPILYYIILYYIILYYIILYCIVLYCIVLYCIVLYCIVLYYILYYALKVWGQINAHQGSIYLIKNTVKTSNIVKHYYKLKWFSILNYFRIIVLCWFCALAMLKIVVLLNIFVETMIHSFQHCLIWSLNMNINILYTCF